jgi:hypothetical protein
LRLCARLGLLFLLGFLVDDRVCRLLLVMVNFGRWPMIFGTWCRAIYLVVLIKCLLELWIVIVVF